MTDMSWEHADETRAALLAIVSDPDYGSAALSSPQILSNLLKDYLPEAPREKSVLIAAAEAGLAAQLGEHVSTGMDPATAIRLTASSFAASTVFQSDACEWVTRELAVALGLISGDAGDALGAPPAPQASSAPTQVASQPTQVSPPPTKVFRQAPLAPGQDFPPAPGPNVAQAPAQGFPQAPAQGFPQAPTQGFPQAAQPGTPGRRRTRPAILLSVIAAAVVVVVVVIYFATSLISGSSVESLNKIVAPFTSQCGPANQSFTLTGTTSSYLCTRTTSTGIDVLAYQFDNTADYQTGFAALNSTTGYVAAGVANTCPPPSGSTTGVTGWHSISTTKYPARSGQLLECYTDAHNHLPLLVWTMPTQRVVLLADDAATGATIGQLYNWWTTLTFG